MNPAANINHALQDFFQERSGDRALLIWSEFTYAGLRLNRYSQDRFASRDRAHAGSAMGAFLRFLRPTPYE
jgi:hypothetical protein